MSKRVGLDVSDEECMQEIEVRDDALEEHEIKGRNGKLDGHESDYLDSSDPGEYGDSGESDEEIWAYAPYNMFQRARRTVLKEIQGSYVEEFANLWGYAAELLHSNPGVQ
ncbi:hypothetical protein V6N12_031013 [Hibiscus sabdariffa]|uniref:Uncharacterized protein n=1 Tax=Hibiscus sabdariffa TaxID=183260 RepID=A0ABR2E7N4_9ROSI